MFSATAFKIRDATLADVPELVRLGWATEEDWPEGRILVGEIRGVVAAGLAIEENRTVLRRRAGRSVPARAHARPRRRHRGARAHPLGRRADPRAHAPARSRRGLTPRGV